MKKEGDAGRVFKDFRRLHRRVRVVRRKVLHLRRHSGEKFGESLCMRNISDRLLEKESVRQQNQSL